LKENDNLYSDTFRAIGLPAPFCISRSNAITAQQFCSIGIVEN
jgi:hypothetical protein